MARRAFVSLGAPGDYEGRGFGARTELHAARDRQLPSLEPRHAATEKRGRFPRLAYEDVVADGLDVADLVATLGIQQRRCKPEGVTFAEAFGVVVDLVAAVVAIEVEPLDRGPLPRL